jgi:hypothetical protein
MSDTHSYSSDVAFTPAVKAIQTARDRAMPMPMSKSVAAGATEIDENLAAFLAETTACFFATANGRLASPNIQHRGGPKGFVKVLDKTRWHSPITAATGNTSPKATSRRTRRRISS